MIIKCRKCGADVDIDDADSGAKVGFKNLMEAISGNASDMYTVCRQCVEKEERACKHRAGMRRIAEDISHGYLREGFERYLHPPADLIEKNKQNWEKLKTRKPSKGVLFAHGPRGTGKSSLFRNYLARCRYFFDSVTVGEVSAADMCGPLWSFDRVEFVERLKKRRVLLIDDVGNARWNVQGLDLFRSIIDYRHECGLMTLMTSNDSPKDLKNKLSCDNSGKPYDSSTLTDRFYPITILEFSGESYRREL